MKRLASRQSEDQQSHIMPLKNILLTLPLLLSTPKMVIVQEREVYLLMKQFDRIIDQVHAHCASVDLEFLRNFYDCLDAMMKAIYINSSKSYSLGE